MKNILILFTFCLINMVSFAQENLDQTSCFKLNCNDTICNYIINIPIQNATSIRKISIETIVTTTGFEKSIGERKLVDFVLVNGQLNLSSNIAFGFLNNALNCQLSVPTVALTQKGYIKITALNADGAVVSQKNINL